ncbi:MAG: Uma2 family endonuclease [Thermomicrobiales bacterium]
MTQQAMAYAEAQDQMYRMTYEEFLSQIDESAHAEWREGEVTVFMVPDTRHQLVSTFLVGLISLYVNLLDLGKLFAAPFEMLLVPGRISREPDILFVAKNHFDRLNDDRLDGPADLVIELLSDSSVTRDRDRKFYEYQGAGIPEYWVFDPRPGKQRADFYQLSAAGKYEVIAPDDAGRYHSSVLPSSWIKPEWVWQDPQPDSITVIAQMNPGLIRTLVQSLNLGQ